jgi:multiple sugar transport system ATP-binding protein
MNLFEARLEREGDSWSLSGPYQKLELAPEVLSLHPGLARYEGATIAAGIRPEDLHDPAELPGHPDGQKLHATVELREALGSDVMVHLSMKGKKVTTEDVREGVEAPEALGDYDMFSVVARFGPRTRVREGDEVPVAVAT